MKNFSLLFSLLLTICLAGCSDSGSDSVDVPEPPASTEGDLGEASGTAEEMFMEETPAEGEGASTAE